MIEIHIHVEGREAVALLTKLVELESTNLADRAAAAAATADLLKGNKLVAEALAKVQAPAA